MEWVVYSKDNIPEYFSESLSNQNGKYNLMERLVFQIKENVFDDYYIAAVFNNNKIVAHIVHTPPYPVQIAILVDADEVIQFISKHLSDHNLSSRGIAGDKEMMEKLANKLYEDWHVNLNEGVFVCHEVINEFKDVPGNTKIAQQEDEILLKEWYIAAMIEMDLEIELKYKNEQQIKATIDGWIVNKLGQFWMKEEEPVSFVKFVPVQEYFAHVGMVYTPKAFRKNGYAARNVALLTKQLLKTFKYTTLYTDLNNSTSNKIYKEIGYKQVAEFIQILPE
ncbi:GNAT family N-acetyltransferase [Mammaliicoccus stepanovicii]|uniref:Predicted acetyltransferase n=1 Tax=Mammaliicoccus stepanovicii TaxID=643214 RepID=A0A239Y7C6_9STAP|nr:GNAT family N-acetyltransferase [Mammaliicoccus stepanovicii]PNZ77050.1 hypothetical protein CD111_05355 [Mammaliicoccus stepanovicii]GGI42996.1 hypothetical protein GCM10010896_21200 [Mammaliicoccus stepanovicii]SNV55151.1 Predicted acetyltransferase [Mammaliicoccus stepanovicii]